LQNHKTLVVKIGNHTDSRGHSNYNSLLTQKRAQMIDKYLVEKGIQADRLVAVGYGEDQLLITDSEISKFKSDLEIEQAHATNRRTTFEIIALDYLE